jgi:hypothetical protein
MSSGIRGCSELAGPAVEAFSFAAIRTPILRATSRLEGAITFIKKINIEAFWRRQARAVVARSSDGRADDSGYNMKKAYFLACRISCFRI